MSVPPRSDRPVLLYSLGCFQPIVTSVIELRDPRSVCEIGVGRGAFSAFLLEQSRTRGCRYTGIDPTLDAGTTGGGDGASQYFPDLSLKVLPNLSHHDIYFLDGDHNYYTVLNELRLIVRPGHHWPVIFLHDVGWPWGRRDQYCAPGTIPPEFRHPCSSTLSVLPGQSGLGEGGLSGETSDYHYCAADHEGGPRNGVLTAVEDFLGELPPGVWKLITIPSVFGLGIVYAPSRCEPELCGYLDRLTQSVEMLRPLLDLLESNRMDLFLAFKGGVHDLSVIHGDYASLRSVYDSLDRHAHALQADYDALDNHTRALKADYDALDNHARALQATFDSLQRSYEELHTHAIALQASYDKLALRSTEQEKL